MKTRPEKPSIVGAILAAVAGFMAALFVFERFLDEALIDAGIVAYNKSAYQSAEIRFGAVCAVLVAIVVRIFAMKKYKLAVREFEAYEASLTSEDKEKIQHLQEMIQKAEEGDANAAYELARAYEFGTEKSIIVDSYKALMYYEMAAKNGHMDAMQTAGFKNYERGATARAEDYFLMYLEATTFEEADAPYVLAEYLVGLCNYAMWQDFKDSNSGERHRVKAYKYLNRAAQHGHEDAAVMIATKF